jgi:hypothetical protein
MISVNLHNPKFENKYFSQHEEDGKIFCYIDLSIPSAGLTPATIFIESSQDARKLAEQFAIIADILEEVAQ